MTVPLITKLKSLKDLVFEMVTHEMLANSSYLKNMNYALMH